MKSKWFKITLIIVLLMRPCTAAWTQDEIMKEIKEEKKKPDIFNVTPAFAFSWYPYAHFMEERSTNTDFDLKNYGMSVIMSLKIFNKVGAHLNLKIDDPTFKKLVDVAGYVTAYYAMLKFDYHSFGGTITWTGNSPNPISGEVYNFRNQWNNVSLLFRVDQLKMRDNPSTLEFFLFGLLHELMLIGTGNLGAIGIGYASFDMPLEYRTQPDRGLINSGFGLVKGEAWGLSILWDTLSWRMERPVSYTRNSYTKGLTDYIWVYVDWFHGFPPLGSFGKGETDAQAIAWMSNANNDVSVNGNINQGMQYAIFKGTLGLQYVWSVGEKSRIGLAVGAELLEETIDAHNADIKIHYWSRHVGPAVRVNARW